MKTTGAHSTRSLKISGCKRWCPKDLRFCAPVLTHSLYNTSWLCSKAQKILFCPPYLRHHCWAKPENLLSVLQGQRDQNVVLGPFIVVASHDIWRWNISSTDSMTQIQSQTDTPSPHIRRFPPARFPPMRFPLMQFPLMQFPQTGFPQTWGPLMWVHYKAVSINAIFLFFPEN